MGLTPPVTHHLITHEDKILKTHTYHQITSSLGHAQQPQSGFDQQRVEESEGARRLRAAEEEEEEEDRQTNKTDVLH